GRLHAAMAEQPKILRSLRLVDAAALTALAAALAVSPAQAAVTAYAAGFTDPVADGPRIALHRPGGAGEIRTAGTTEPVAGTHPAVGANRKAWLDANGITIEGLTTFPAPGA